MRGGGWKQGQENDWAEMMRGERSKDGGNKKKKKNQIGAKMANKHENTLLCFPIMWQQIPPVSFIIQCQNIYPLQTGMELKSNSPWELFLDKF